MSDEYSAFAPGGAFYNPNYRGAPPGMGLQFDIPQANGGMSLEDQFFARGIQGYDEVAAYNTRMGDIAQKNADKVASPWATGAQTFGTVAQGLAGLANIYLGYQGMKQQKKAFEFNKGVINTNLGNSISDYNRRLNDTLQNRALNNGQGSGWVSQQLAQYSAKRAP